MNETLNVTGIRILPKGRIYLKLMDDGFDDAQVDAILKVIEPEMEAIRKATLNTYCPLGRNAFYSTIGAVTGVLIVWILEWLFRVYR